MPTVVPNAWRNHGTLASTCRYASPSHVQLQPRLIRSRINVVRWNKHFSARVPSPFSWIFLCFRFVPAREITLADSGGEGASKSP